MNPKKSLSFLAGNPVSNPAQNGSVLPVFPPAGRQNTATMMPASDAVEPASTADTPAAEKVHNQTSDTRDLLQLIPLDAIDPPTISQRQTYPREMVDRMAQAIRRQGKGDNLAGQISPIVVMPSNNTPGRYQIIDGFTRYQAFADHFLASHIKATVKHGLDQREVFQIAFSANVDRNATTDFDRGMALAQAFSEGVFRDKTEVANSLGIDKVTAGGLLAFANFPEFLLEIIRPDPSRFSYNFAYKLQTLMNKQAKEDELIALVQKIRDGKLSFKKFSQLVSDYHGQVERPKRSRRDTRSIMGYGKVKATDNTVILDLASLPQDLAPKLADSLEKFITDFLKQNIPSEQIAKDEQTDKNHG